MSVLLSLVNVCAMPFGAMDFTSQKCYCSKCDNLGHSLANRNTNTRNSSPDILRHELSKSTKCTNELTDKLTTLSLLSESHQRTTCQTSLPLLSVNKQSCFTESSTDVVDGLMFTSQQNLSQCNETFSKDVSAPASPCHRRSFSFPVMSQYTPDICSDLLKGEKKGKEVVSTNDGSEVGENLDHIQKIEKKLRTDSSYLLEEGFDVNGRELEDMLVGERRKHPMVWKLPPTPTPPKEEDVVEEQEAGEEEDEPNVEDLIRIGICLRAMADNYGESQQIHRPDSDAISLVFNKSLTKTFGKVLGVSLLTFIVWRNFTSPSRVTDYLQSFMQL